MNVRRRPTLLLEYQSLITNIFYSITEELYLVLLVLPLIASLGASFRACELFGKGLTRAKTAFSTSVTRANV